MMRDFFRAVLAEMERGNRSEKYFFVVVVVVVVVVIVIVAIS